MKNTEHGIILKRTTKSGSVPCFFCGCTLFVGGLDLLDQLSGCPVCSVCAAKRSPDMARAYDEAVAWCEDMEDEAEMRGIVNGNDAMKQAMTKELHHLIDVFLGNPEVPRASELKNFSNFSRNREDL